MAGKKLVMNSHSDAIGEGIDAVYQTLALADHLDPASNMFLGNELTRSFLGITVLDNKKMRSETERVLMERLGVQLKSLDAPTESLSGGQRQAVAIARAVYHELRTAECSGARPEAISKWFDEQVNRRH